MVSERENTKNRVNHAKAIASSMTLLLELESLCRHVYAEKTSHRCKLELARLVVRQAPASAANQLDLAERFLNGEASIAELAEARTDVWSYLGSLACYCSATDSASAQAILGCLETDPSAHTFASLLEQVERVARCGVSEAEIARVLGVKR